MSTPLPPFHPDPASARTLPARLYHDPAILEAERARIFARTWQPVCNVDAVREPGQQLAVQAAGEPLVVVRDLLGGLRAFYDVCPHRAGPLTPLSLSGPGSQGQAPPQPQGASCQRKTLQCRYHGWTFALDGRLLHAPGFEVPPDAAPALSLRPVEVAEFGPLVFVRLSGPHEPVSLSDHLGEIVEELSDLRLDDLRLSDRREYPVRANWKVYVDNYVEGYHIPLIHKDLMRELDYPSYRVETRRFHSKQHSPIRPAEADGPPRQYSPDEGSGTGRFYWLFPNVMLNCYPDHLQLNVVQPIALDQTVVLFEWYFRDPEHPRVQHKRAGHITLAETVQAEDAAICEAVQQRLRSRSYDTGCFVPAHEGGVHHFQALWHDFMSHP